MLFTLKCPTCGANLNIDDKLEIAFCTYCGTRIADIPQRIELKGKVQVDGMVTEQNLIFRARQFANNGDFDSAIVYCNRVLDINPENAEAANLLKQASSTIDQENVMTEVSGAGRILGDPYYINKVNKGFIKNGLTKLKLGIGDYKIRFGAWSFAKDNEVQISIRNRSTRVRIQFVKDNGKFIARLIS